jgi:hypothetical protein
VAILDSELLVQALDEGWSHWADLAETLAGYETTGNATTSPMQEMFTALRADPVGTSRFFGDYLS